MFHIRPGWGAGAVRTPKTIEEEALESSEEPRAKDIVEIRE